MILSSASDAQDVYKHLIKIKFLCFPVLSNTIQKSQFIFPHLLMILPDFEHWCLSLIVKCSFFHIVAFYYIHAL